MARPEFENQTSISAITNKKIDYIELIDSAPMSNGVLMKYTFKSPPNTVSKVIGAFFTMDSVPGMTLGQRKIAVDMALTDTTGIGILLMKETADNTNLNRTFRFIHGKTSHSVGGPVDPDDYSKSMLVPNDEGSFALSLRNLEFDENIGVTVMFNYYTSQAIATASPQRKIYLFVERETVER